MGSKEKEELKRFEVASKKALKPFSAREQLVIGKYWEIVKKEIKKLEKADKESGKEKTLDDVKKAMVCPKCAEVIEYED